MKEFFQSEASSALFWFASLSSLTDGIGIWRGVDGGPEKGANYIGTQKFSEGLISEKFTSDKERLQGLPVNNKPS